MQMSTLSDKLRAAFVLSAALLAAGLVFTRVLSLDSTLLLGAALCGAGLSAYLGFRFPLTTLVLTIFFGQAVDRDLIEIEWVIHYSVAGIKLRYFDPILLAIFAALTLRLFATDNRLSRYLFLTGGLWTVFMVWMSMQSVRTLGIYGPVASIGELRTYYQYMLVIPYTVSFFRTEAAQWRLFKVLMITGFLFAFMSILRGGLDFGFQIGPRWFNASSNFALLTGLVSLLVAAKLKTIHLKDHHITLLSVLFVFLTVVNTHRSVWLATFVAISLLVLLRIIPLKRYIQLSVAIIIASVAVTIIFPYVGLADEGLSEFLQRRFRAFTDYESDPTASWRSFLWAQVVEIIRTHPWLGVGLGNNFQLWGPDGNIWTVSPHNHYLMVGYHAGVTGIVLYALFVLQFAYHLLRQLAQSLTARQRTMLMSTLINCVAAHFLFVAYPHEFYTVLYMGLGAAIIVSRVQQPVHALRGLSARLDALRPPEQAHT